VFFLSKRKNLSKLAAAVVLAFHAVPTYACIANPLIGMIAPIGVEWFLLSPWSPFYSFWETRWLVFNMVSIPAVFGVNLNFIIGWTLFTVGFSIFLVAAVQFFSKRRKGLVTTGLYSAVRHPQYLGIIAATLGFTIASERPMAWIAWLNLTFLYLLVARSEEQVLRKNYEKEIQAYEQQARFIFPVPTPNITKRLYPKSKFGKCLISILVYTATMIIAWVILKQFSYNLGPFWT
jgi:protein-S-isoprenylcysteine O-methyltransferase Ste14